MSSGDGQVPPKRWLRRWDLPPTIAPQNAHMRLRFQILTDFSDRMNDEPLSPAFNWSWHAVCLWSAHAMPMPRRRDLRSPAQQAQNLYWHFATILA